MAIHGTGRRLHQLAVLDQYHRAWSPTVISSPDPDEEAAVKARYTEPYGTGSTASPELLVTHVIDGHVAAGSTRRVVLIPPVSVLSSDALVQLRRRARGGVVHVVPPVRLLPFPAPVLVQESASRTELRAASFRGRSPLEILLDRAVWAIAVASWSVNADLTSGLDVKSSLAGSMLCLHAMPVIGLFAAVDGPSERLGLVTVDGRRSSCPCHRVDNDLFLRTAVRCGREPDGDSARFAGHYLDALLQIAPRDVVRASS